jgi:hypothetical protein
MRILKNLGLVLALILIMSGAALSQSMKPEMWNGTHWKEFSKEVKVAYLKGMGNLADLEVAVDKDRAGCLSTGLVKDLQGKSIDSIVQEVDKYYKDNPDKINTPVVEVVVRSCTALCKPVAKATPKK